MRHRYVFSLLLFTIPIVAAGQAKSSIALFQGTDLEWKDGPPSLPKGAKMAILEGDPTQPGVFTMRLRFPDGFQVFPHWHTQTEHATVIKGTLHLGMGDRFDRSSTTALRGDEAFRLGRGRDDSAAARPGTLDHHLRERGGRPADRASVRLSP